MTATRPTLAAALLLLASCGGDEKPFTDLEGIYTIGSWTRNETGCTAEGPQVPGSDGFLWIKEGSFFGARFLGVVTCADLPTCRADSAGEVPILGGWLLGRGNDRDGWTGEIAWSTTGPSAGTCSGGLTSYRLSQPAAGLVSLRAESRSAPTFPENGQGECDPQDAAALAGPTPCLTLEVVAATYLEGLP